MRVVTLSDTHEQHRSINVPEGDLLIHAGDITYSGEAHVLRDFADWFESQPHRWKVCIGGNHDFLLERDTLKGHFSYLHDSATFIDGFLVYGSPFTPKFGNWAFMRERGNDIKRVWEKIPMDTDILITHGPPMGILDVTAKRWGSKSVGCFDLMEKVKVVKPILHVFGHIHSGYGTTEKDGTIFVNASNCTEEYEAKNIPIVVDIARPTIQTKEKEGGEMSFKEEFEKAYLNARVHRLFGGPYPDPDKVALWAAKWMGERCAERAKSAGALTEYDLRQLVKELE